MASNAPGAGCTAKTPHYAKVAYLPGIGYTPTVSGALDECMLSVVRFNSDDYVLVDPDCSRVSSQTVFLKRDQDVVIGTPPRIIPPTIPGTRPVMYLRTPSDWHSPAVACEIRTLYDDGIASADYQLMVQSHADNVFVLVPRTDTLTVTSLAAPSSETHEIRPLAPSARERLGFGSILLFTTGFVGSFKPQVCIAVVVAPPWLGSSDKAIFKWHLVLTHLHNNLIGMWNACFVDQTFRVPDYSSIKPHIRGVVNDSKSDVQLYYHTYLRPKTVARKKADGKSDVEAAVQKPSAQKVSDKGRVNVQVEEAFVARKRGMGESAEDGGLSKAHKPS